MVMSIYLCLGIVGYIVGVLVSYFLRHILKGYFYGSFVRMVEGDGGSMNLLKKGNIFLKF